MARAVVYVPARPIALDTVLGAVIEAATLPVRIAVAFTRATLALGVLADPEGPVRRPGGYGDQVAEVLRGDGGAMHLAQVLTELTAPDRPVGKMLARGGTLDRLLADHGPVHRLVQPGGALERLVAEGGALDRVVAHEGALDRLLAEGGIVDRLTRPGGLLDQVLRDDGLVERLVADDGLLEKLISDGGTLDRLVDLGDSLEHLQPQLVEIAGLVPSLSESVDALHRAVVPLGELVRRLPGGRRRYEAAAAHVDR